MPPPGLRFDVFWGGAKQIQMFLEESPAFFSVCIFFRMHVVLSLFVALRTIHGAPDSG